MRLAVAKVESDRWDEDIQVEVILVNNLAKGVPHVVLYSLFG